MANRFPDPHQRGALLQGAAAVLAVVAVVVALVQGALLSQLGRAEEARVAFDRAISLANTAAEAAHIRLHLDRLIKDSAPQDGATASAS